ncbi:hypothetical protein ACI798_08385 [Geodermatophilus sp. SYSU D01045]
MTPHRPASRWYPAEDPWEWAGRHGLWRGDDVAATALVLAVAERAEDASPWAGGQVVRLVRSVLDDASPAAGLLAAALAGPAAGLAGVAATPLVHVRAAVAARRDLPRDVAAVLGRDEALRRARARVAAAPPEDARGLVGEFRAWSLGRALLRQRGTWTGRARLAVRLGDAGGDLLAELGRTPAPDLLARATGGRAARG